MEEVPSDKGQISFVLSIINMALLLIFGIYTIILRKKQAQLVKNSKMTDVLLDCNKRFNEIDLLRRSREVNAQDYFEQFWYLQYDQYTFWKEGFVSDQTFGNWLNDRRDEWVQNNEIGGVTYRDAWTFIKKTWKQKKFIGVFEDAMEKSIYPKLKI